MKLAKTDNSKPANRQCSGVFSPSGVTLLGMLVNIALAAVKAVVGLATASGALLADAVHSSSDLVSDIAVLAALGSSNQAPDKKHPYGHRRIQTLAALAIGLLVIFAGGSVGYSAVKNWLSGNIAAYGIAPLLVAIGSALAKEILYHITVHVGRKTNNTALLANAWHHRTDAFSSIAASVGISAVTFGGAKWGFMDNVTAIAFAGILAAMGLKFCRDAAAELIDAAPRRDICDQIAKIVSNTDGVKSYHAFRMRQMAGKLEMDVHILVDPQLSVGEGHDIASEVSQRIKASNPNVANTIIHIEPAEDF